MLKKLLELDQYLFLKINKDSANSFFDSVMPFFREPKFWAPLYLFILVFVIINFQKKAVWWCLGFIITVAATDSISSKIIKPLFARPRPCMDADFANRVRLVAGYCGGNGSFTSSHAANHFGMAMFLFVTLNHIAPTYIKYFFLWAVLVCYAQVYVGVHYPSDVFGGAILGMIVGSLTGKIFNKRNGLMQPSF